MPKLDPSNYTLSEEEKVFNLCQNTKDLILDRCQCNVSIDQKEKTVKISVDPSLAQLYEEGLTTLERLYPQEMDFDEDEEDDEDFSSEKLQKLQKRFDISYRDEIEEWEKEPKHYHHEFYGNALSGSAIRFALGEGLLDFCYHDFKKHIPNFSLLFAVLSEDAIKLFATDEDNDELPTKTEKIKNLDEYTDYMDLRWKHINELGNSFFYLSLYTAIFTPLFLTVNEKSIARYLRYLLFLQKDFQEKLEFCFDPEFYPSVLGHLTSVERYKLYVATHPHATTSYERREDFSIISCDDSDYILNRLNTDFNTSSCEYNEFIKKYFKNDPPDVIFKIPYKFSVSYECSSILEMLELEFSKMLELDIKMRKCKRCGRYFIMKGNYDTNYCTRILDGQTRTCQELAAQENYKAKANENPALRIYSKYYKRYAARVRSKQLKEKEFKSWKYKALTMRDECTKGKITAEEYVAWLEAYFPNRKQRN